MAKTTIIEAQSSNTVYDNGGSGILGKLKGVFADFKNGTRNGGRIYSEELWDNRVFGNEDVMEALNTKTLFGELDHPDGDRCETLAKNAAISITKLEKRPDEGVIYGEAEILDTPTGRIVKALAESGAKLGISSRGMGEEVYYEGKNYIDPDTYDFITFDVVVTPANTKARVALTESKQISKLTEGLQKEINTCETANQLDQIKAVVENVNVANKDALLKSINEKLNIRKESKIASKIIEINNKIALKTLKSQLAEARNELAESIEAGKQLQLENSKLIATNNKLSAMRSVANKNLHECKTKISELKDELKTELEDKAEIEEQLAKVTSENEEQATKITGLVESNKKMASRLVNASKIDVAYRKLQEAFEELKNQSSANAQKLTESNNKARQNNNSLLKENRMQAGKIKELEDKIASLTAENSKLEEAQNRFSKLSFNPIGTCKAFYESKHDTGIDAMSEEDKELFDALVGKEV